MTFVFDWTSLSLPETASVGEATCQTFVKFLRPLLFCFCLSLRYFVLDGPTTVLSGVWTVMRLAAQTPVRICLSSVRLYITLSELWCSRSVAWPQRSGDLADTRAIYSAQPAIDRIAVLSRTTHNRCVTERPTLLALLATTKLPVKVVFAALTRREHSVYFSVFVISVRSL